MASSRSGGRGSRILGLVLIVAAPTLALGTWNSTRQPREVLAMVERRRGTANALDPATDASAVYHASHAQATLANRWKPTGYATLGVIGTTLGAILLFFGFRRRTDPL